MEVILNINDLTYKNIFNNLSIYIEKNKFITISGPNNCGKTTLLRILSKQIQISNNIILYNKKIDDYKIEDYTSEVRCIIPKEILFTQSTLEEELYYQSDLTNKDKKYLIDYLVKNLKIRKLLSKNISTLQSNEIVLSQLAISLVNHPKILLLDSIDRYLSKKELENAYNTLKDFQNKFGLTVILTTTDLNQSLFTDYLYIINNGQISLQGKPIEILQRDNLINKAGLSLPFTIDLCVKLRDYELIENITLDKKKIVGEIWK